MTAEHAPVLVAEARPGDQPVPQQPYAHIVVALDGSPLAERVLAYVEPLATAFGSQVTCVCAVESLEQLMARWYLGPGYGGAVSVEPLVDTQDQIRAEDAAYLEHIKERLAKQGIAVKCEEPEGRAAEVIVATARTQGANLIAMTTHGRSGLGRAFLGSVADEVVRTAPCPVLLVRSRAD
jgi:nucleotide-binding universal stress UspA family protein